MKYIYTLSIITIFLTSSANADFWGEAKFKDIIKQEQDYSCGAASLAYLINRKDPNRSIAERDVIEKIGLEDGGGYSLLDIKEASSEFGFQFISYQIKRSDFEKLPVPFMAAVNFLGTEHFTVVTYHDKNIVKVYEHSWGNEIIDKRSFFLMARGKRNILDRKSVVVGYLK